MKPYGNAFINFICQFYVIKMRTYITSGICLKVLQTFNSNEKKISIKTYFFVQPKLTIWYANTAKKKHLQIWLWKHIY